MTITLPHNGTPTSRAASKAPGVASKSGHDRRVLCQYVASRGAQGASDEGIAAGCPDVHPNAVRARRAECWAHGMIVDTGERRRSAAGLLVKVYHITAKGIEALGMPEGSWCVR